MRSFMPRPALWLIVLLVLVAAGCAKKHVPTGKESPRPGVTKVERAPSAPAPVPAPKPYTQFGKTYYPLSTAHGYTEEGLASWYGRKFHGRRTSSGETYDMHAYTAAHRVLPLGTKVLVTNLDTGQSVQVRINDRGPFVDVHKRIIDLSYAAANKLGMANKGLARVRIESVGNVSGAAGNDLAGRFYIQVGAFSNEDNAALLKRQLVGKGYDGTRLVRVKVGGKTFWRVQAGVFLRLSAAQKAISEISAEHPSAFILAGS